MKQTYSASGAGTQELISAGEIRALSGVSYEGIHLWVKEGKLHPIAVGNPMGPHGGQMKLFRRNEVVAFLAQRNATKRKKQKNAARS